MQGNMKMSQLSYPTNMNSYSINQNWIFLQKKSNYRILTKIAVRNMEYWTKFT